MIFLHVEMMWGVELVHMVRVEWNEKSRWVNLSKNMHLSGYYSCSERSRPKAQRLGEVMVEGKNDFFALGDGVGS